jgi:hypothetical protein
MRLTSSGVLRQEESRRWRREAAAWLAARQGYGGRECHDRGHSPQRSQWAK